VKPREDRQKVMIRARMLSGALWSDVCILNLSRRGVGLQCATPPVRGTYVEIRRGGHVIVGRVVWTKGHRLGLRSQDALAIETIVREPDHSSKPPQGAVVAGASARDRRSRPRVRLERHETSRIAARAMEFGVAVVAAVSVALMVFQSVEQTLAIPLARVAEAVKH